MKLNEMYQGLGISPAVYEYGEAVLKDLRERFDAIDQAAEYNQAKVLSAFQKNRVDAACFAATTGYGYNDVGREKLELVYADVFHTEAALVRPQITCGTHALTVALSANLLPGDELLSPVGAPYDTLQEVIGIRPSPCSLAEYGVSYRQVELLADGTFDYEGIRAAIHEKTKLITIQRSKGYATRPTFSVAQIGEDRLLQIREARCDLHGGQLLRGIHRHGGALGRGGRHGGGEPHQEPRRRSGPHRRLHLRHQGVRGPLRLPPLRSWPWAGGGRKPGPHARPVPGILPGPHGVRRGPEGRHLCRQHL